MKSKWFLLKLCVKLSGSNENNKPEEIKINVLNISVMKYQVTGNIRLQKDMSTGTDEWKNVRQMKLLKKLISSTVKI